MAEKNKFIVIEEKPKRGHDDFNTHPKLRARIIVLGLISLFFSFLVLGFVTCFGATDCNGYDMTLDLTATSIVETNLWTQARMTETADAIPVNPEESDAESTFMYLDQNHTPFALPEHPTSASPFPTNPFVSTSTPKGGFDGSKSQEQTTPSHMVDTFRCYRATLRCL